MEFRDVLPLLPYLPRTIDRQLELLEKLSSWFTSPAHLKTVLTIRLSMVFEQQYFNEICSTHKRILDERFYKAKQLGQRLDTDREFGDVLSGLAQTKLGRDIRFDDPGFKLLLSLVRRRDLGQ